jgi:hypothetical protein
MSKNPLPQIRQMNTEEKEQFSTDYTDEWKNDINEKSGKICAICRLFPILARVFAPAEW